MSTSFRWKAAIIIVVAVVVRLAFVVAVEKGILKVEVNPDSSDLLSFAYNLSTGIGFAHSVDETQPYSQPVEFSAWRPPLYPASVALAFQFSRNTLYLRALQIALAAGSLYFFLRLACVLFGELAALIAGLAFALYPPLIWYASDLGTESLFLFLLMTVLFVFYVAARQHSAAHIFWLGILIGLAALCRPNGLMLAPALVLALWLENRNWAKTAQRTIILALAIALVVLPWSYRNYRLFHKFVLISTNGGATLWGGAHLRLEPGATLADLGYSQHQAFRDLAEPDRERYYFHQAMLILDHSPRRWASLWLANFEDMYTLSPSPLYHSLRNRLIYSVSYIPLLIFGLAGFWMLRRRWKELSLLWGWMLTNTALYCIFLSSIRYRVPTIDPIFMLAAGVSLAALVGRFGTWAPVKADPTR